MDNIVVQSPSARFMARVKYWIAGGLIRDPRSAIYLLGILTAVALFLVFYLWQVTAAYSAIQNSLVNESTYFSFGGRVLHGEVVAGVWKTHADDGVGFEFKYPANWILDDRSASSVVVSPGGPRSLNESDRLKIGDAWPNFRITVYPNGRGLDPIAYYERVTAPGLRDDVEHGAIEVSLGGRSAVQFTDLGVTERRFYLVGSDEQMLEVSFDVDPPSVFGDIEDTFDAMARSVVIR